MLRLHALIEGNQVSSRHLSSRRAGKRKLAPACACPVQTVLVLAEMNDGSVRSGTASIVVTLGACVEEVWGN
jgi:hypothetical protein